MKWIAMIVLGVFAFTGCKSTDVKDTDPAVRYTIVVTNVEGLPLDSVKVTVSTNEGDEITKTTNDNGKVVIEVETSTNQIDISRKGYLDQQTIDNVVLPTDSSDTGRIVFKILEFTMTVPGQSVTSISSSSIFLSSSSRISSSSKQASSSSN